MAAAWRVGALLWALYLLTYGGGPHAVDEIGQLGATAGLVKHGSFAADDLLWTIGAAGDRADAQVEVGPSGEVWSKRGPAVPLVMAPWYALAMALPWLDLAFTALLAMSLVTAATGGLLTRLALDLGLSERAAIAAGLVYGVAGLAWPYARLGFGEPLIALAVVGAALAGRRGGWGAGVAGAFVVLATATKWPAALLAAPIGLYTAWRTPYCPSRGWWLVALARLVRFGSVVMVGLAVLAYYNWSHFGSPVATGYGVSAREGFGAPPLYGLTGLLVSAYRGVVWFAPAVAAGAALLPTAARRDRATAWLAGGVAVATLATYAGWWTWWGGFTWGPRFLLPAGPLLVLMLPMAWPALGRGGRGTLVLVVASSALLQVPGVLLDFNPYEKAIRAARPDFPRAGEIWDANASPIVGHVVRLATEGTCALDLAWIHCGHLDLVVGVTLGLTVMLGGLALARRRAALDALAAAALMGSVAVLLVRGPTGPAGSANDLLEAARARDRLAALTDGTVVLATPEVPALWGRDRWRGWTYGFNRDDIPRLPEAERLLNLAAARHDRLWLLAAGVPREDPTNGVERWLEQEEFPADERSFGGARLRLFLTGAVGLAPEARALAVFADGAARLVASRLLDQAVGPRRFARLQLLWQASRPPDGVSVFVHLYEDGRLVGQADAPWRERGHYALALKEPSGSGSAQVEVGLYRADGSRLTARSAEGARFAEDRVPIGRLTITD